MASKHSKSFLSTVKDMCVSFITPSKNSNTKLSLPFKIVSIVLTVSLIVSAIFIVAFFAEGSSHEGIITEAKEIFYSRGGNAAIKILSDENKDIKGWLNIPNTDICYAVCQGTDDKYYTTHNQKGEESRYGALSLSVADSFERKGNDQNIVIFGNNMKDGSMFGSLKEYRKLPFYKQNPTFELYYGEKKEKYVIFAIMLLASQDEDKTNTYNATKSHFADKKEFNDWYSETYSRSMISTKVKVEYGDKMLTLVTSANDFEGARLVVMAKKLSDDEAVNTKDATINSKIKYPKNWYTKRGLKYPY